MTVRSLSPATASLPSSSSWASWEFLWQAGAGRRAGPDRTAAMAGGRRCGVPLMRGRRCGVPLTLLALAAAPCSAFFWQPLRCLNASWAARGPVCSGEFSARTCARSQADLDAYLAALETSLLGLSAARTRTAVPLGAPVCTCATAPRRLRTAIARDLRALPPPCAPSPVSLAAPHARSLGGWAETGDTESCIADLRDRLPPCSDDETQLTTPQVLNNYCCGRGSTCESDADCLRLESLSGYRAEPSTVLELGGHKADFISVPASATLDLTSTSFSFAFWARRRKVSTRMMVLWHNAPHSNLHIGFRESDAFVFSFTNTGWDTSSGLQSATTYPNDLGVWVHWAGSYNVATGIRKILRNGKQIATDAVAGGYPGGNLDLHISSGSVANPNWSNGPFHGSLDQIFLFKRVLNDAEIALLVRNQSPPMDLSSLVLHFTFEQPSITNPQLGPAGSNVTDLSGQNNHGILFGDWNRSLLPLLEDRVPMSVTCATSPHHPSTEACERTRDLYLRGPCADFAQIELHAGTGETKLADLTLPSGYEFPCHDQHPGLLALKAKCTEMCDMLKGSLSSTGCELQITASSAACYGHSSDRMGVGKGTFTGAGQQYCWSANTFLTGTQLPASKPNLTSEPRTHTAVATRGGTSEGASSYDHNPCSQRTNPR